MPLAYTYNARDIVRLRALYQRKEGDSNPRNVVNVYTLSSCVNAFRINVVFSLLQSHGLGVAHITHFSHLLPVPAVTEKIALSE